MEFSVYARAVSGTARVRIYFEALKARKTVLRDFNVSADKWTEISVKFTKEDVDYGLPYVCMGLLRGGVLFDCAFFGAAGKNKY